MGQFGNRLLKKGAITEEQLATAIERQQKHGGRIGQNLVELGFISEEDLQRFFKASPSMPSTVEETGLDLEFITELIMKHALFMGNFKLTDVAERIRLSMAITQQAIDILRRDKCVEVTGGTGYANIAYTFKLTDYGKDRASGLMNLCNYIGPAPVPLDAYRGMVEYQTIKNVMVNDKDVREAFSHLILNDNILKRLGPALSSGRTLFLYGPPGNGKTAIAETIGRILPDTVYVPYAVTVGGQIINVFDPINHIQAENVPQDNVDQRWTLIKRPVVITGGELSLRMLDLDFDPISKFYEASLQMKANNGLFIVDDFGRQQIDPQNLLNRWIVPLDRGIDFMNLHTGMKFSIPFDMLVIFATNLEPKSLVDEAFLRRIHYKIKIDHPTEREYYTIFKLVCDANGMAFNQEVFEYLVSNYYRRLEVPFNACHPRDIIEHMLINSRYQNKPLEMTRENVDVAWQDHFVDM
jgi:energy-coupling factor transporter ATP-binding protein EcfA2